ncbi:MAG: hypothetical protein GC160_21925 [Acidobacteria bacterium]|nr:hypothetical protein [Acidobacteriota bacterium]
MAAAVAYFSICLALVQAPFNHIHAAGAADRHMAETHAGGLAFHMHLGGNQNGSGMGALGLSVRALAWFRFEVKAPVNLDVDLSESAVALAEPNQRPEWSWVAAPESRLHDPPEGLRLVPRGPPSC